MDVTSANHWLSEMEMDDQALFDHQWQGGSFYPPLDFNFNSESHSDIFQSSTTASWNSCTTQPSSSSSSRIISFANERHLYNQKPKEEPNSHSPSKNGASTHAQDHVLAERKRREKLSQRFIALSTIVPGLKKTDKASILGDTIKYLKHLQERMKTLEEHTRKRTVESVVLMKKSHLSHEDDNSSTDENFTSDLPEIEVKLSESNVLLRFHCLKQKGLLVKLLEEIEKLRLTTVNSSVLPFGNFAIDITVIATMDDEFCFTAKDLVARLRSAILN